MTMQNKHTIIWQKWADPFGEDDVDEILDFLSTDQSNDDYANYYDDNQKITHDSENQERHNIRSRRNIKVMATPMGIIPFTENTASSKIFNFWTGHTNFDITPKVATIIEQTSGVETLDIFTRYRFRIAIGKAFKDSNVMQKINETIYEYLEQ